MKRIIKALAFAMAVSVIIVGTAGCGGAAPNGESMASTAAASPQAIARDSAANVATGGGGMNTFAMTDEMVEYEMAEEPMPTEPPPVNPIEPIDPTGPEVQPNATERKIIYTAEVSLQTKEFDKGIASIEEMATRMGGFIQSSNVQGTNLYDSGYGRGNARYAHYTLRIPQARLQECLSLFDGSFNVLYSNLYTDDITGNYYDIQARLDSLRVQQERLLDMLSKAEEVEYLIEVERELARVGYEIESLTSSIRRMDDSVSYSTVNVNIEEVVEYQSIQPINATFGEKVSKTLSEAWTGFVEFCTGFVLFLVAVLPSLIILVPIALIVIWILLRRRRRKNAAAAPKETTAPNEGGNTPQA